MDPETEICAQCGYDSGLYTWDDLVNTVGTSSGRWRWMLEGLDPAVIEARPAPEVWSAFEYLAHSSEIVAMHGLLLHVILTMNGTDLGDPPEVAAPTLPDSATEALSALEENCRRLVRKAHEFEPEARGNSVVIGGQRLTARFALGHVVHDLHHHLADVGRGLHSLGAGAPCQTGRVTGLFASSGGVPKAALTSASVSTTGIEGDSQADRRNHGRPWQALCIWSEEVAAELVGKGHPLYPGSLGENVVVAGIDWDLIRPGVRLWLGRPEGGVLVEVSGYATPCNKIAASFSDGDYFAVDPDRHPGRARVYASVLRAGRIAAGDPVLVEPQ